MSDKTTVLPENILKRMAPEERAKMGRSGMLAQEAQDKFAANCEKQVHIQIQNWLRLKSIFCIHSRMDKKTHNALGTPDFVFAWNWGCDTRTATPMAIEVKVGANKMSDEQIIVQQQMLQNGWCYHVVHSLEMMLSILNVPNHTK